jgi:hypothetical protein
LEIFTDLCVWRLMILSGDLLTLILSLLVQFNSLYENSQTFFGNTQMRLAGCLFFHVNVFFVFFYLSSHDPTRVNWQLVISRLCVGGGGGDLIFTKSKNVFSFFLKLFSPLGLTRCDWFTPNPPTNQKSNETKMAWIKKEFFSGNELTIHFQRFFLWPDNSPQMDGVVSWPPHKILSTSFSPPNKNPPKLFKTKLL